MISLWPLFSLIHFHSLYIKMANSCELLLTWQNVRLCISHSLHHHHHHVLISVPLPQITHATNTHNLPLYILILYRAVQPYGRHWTYWCRRKSISNIQYTIYYATFINLASNTHTKQILSVRPISRWWQEEPKHAKLPAISINDDMKN